MRLTVLTVAYPFAQVSAATAGGAEQVVRAIDRALARERHRSIVIAMEGSEVAGELVSVPRCALDERSMSETHARVRQEITKVVATEAVDCVHLHGVDAAEYLPELPVPELVTLHLPFERYDGGALERLAVRAHLHCVSAEQHRSAPPGLRLLPPIENGVAMSELAGYPHRRRDYVLVLARICPEKGVGLALLAAHLAGVSLLIGGDLFPYPAHERYFAREARPLLDDRRRYIGALGPARKRRLLGAARALLVPSQIAETSSLVAREAMACGCPVIAFGQGALASIVESGRTGYLVSGVEEMADAIELAHRIDPDECRRAARERFDDGPMLSAYLATYQRLALGEMRGARGGSLADPLPARASSRGASATAPPRGDPDRASGRQG